MSRTNEMISANAAFASSFELGHLGAAPTAKVAIVACMDSRIDTFRAFGLRAGEAHIIRNAGGIATDDTIRSLMLSQRLLGTEEIVLIHHTACGLLGANEAELYDEIESETGARPAFALEAFDDVDDDVRKTAERIRACRYLRHDRLRGFVYEVETGRLREIPLG